MEEKKDRIPLDAKLLSLALIELNISRRNVSIYPENHPSIKASIEKAFRHLQELFEIRDEITLAIAKDTLIIDEYALDRKNPVYNEFAMSLYNMGIASLTFVTGVTEEEIIKFHRLITTDYDTLKEKGGLEKMLSRPGINHIKIGLIDYSAFHFVKGKKDLSKEKTNIWEDYVYGLMEGKLLTGADAEGFRAIPPAALSEMINSTFSGSEDNETYDKVITTYLHETSEKTRLKKGALGNVMNFIEGLNPSLKKQFLSGTFRHLTADPAETAKLAGGISSENLMLILKEVNERDEVIPETLKNLLEKFSKIKMKAVTMDTKCLNSGESVVDDIQLSPEAIKLFEHESKSRDYVSDSYKEELRKITDAEFDSVVDKTIRAVQSECKEENLDRFISELVLEFLEEDLYTEDELNQIPEKLLEYINFFQQTGQFDKLTVIFDRMTAFASINRYETISGEILDYMNSEEFIGDLMASYRFWGRKSRAEVIEFSRRLKEKLAEPLLDTVSAEDNTFLRHFYLDLLAGFGDYIIPLARERLNDKRWFVRRNMLVLLREVNKSSVLKDIKPYCTDRDIRLAAEAIKTYLHFNSPDVYKFIRLHLQSGRIEARDQIIKLIAAYRVKRLVPDLLKLFIKKDALGGDFHLKIPIVKALGEIGDTRALKYLLDICRSKSFLYRNSLEELKLAIFKSLNKYPLSDIRPFVTIGLKSKNDQVVSICSILLEKMENSERPKKA